MAHGPYLEPGDTLRGTRMDLRILLLAATLFAALGFAACGDGADDDAEPTTDASSSATPGGIPDDFGPAPKLDGNIDAITPVHAESVRQATTRSPNSNRPRGLCAQVNFDDLPGQDTLRWFRFAFDGTEVTDQLTWTLAPEGAARPGGTACFAPAAGFEVGKHTAAVSVEDPNNPAAPRKQIVGWAFEVIE